MMIPTPICLIHFVFPVIWLSLSCRRRRDAAVAPQTTRRHHP